MRRRERSCDVENEYAAVADAPKVSPARRERVNANCGGSVLARSESRALAARAATSEESADER